MMDNMNIGIGSNEADKESSIGRGMTQLERTLQFIKSMAEQSRVYEEECNRLTILTRDQDNRNMHLKTHNNSLREQLDKAQNPTMGTTTPFPTPERTGDTFLMSTLVNDINKKTRTENQELTSRIEVLMHNNTSLQGEIESLKQDRAKGQQGIEGYIAQVSNQDKTIQSLINQLGLTSPDDSTTDEDTITVLRRENEKLRKENAWCDSDSKAVARENERLRTEMEGMTRERTMRIKTEEYLTEQSNERQSTLIQIKHEIRETLADLNKYRNRADTLHTALEVAKDNIADLNKRLETAGKTPLGLSEYMSNEVRPTFNSTQEELDNWFALPRGGFFSRLFRTHFPAPEPIVWPEKPIPTQLYIRVSDLKQVNRYNDVTGKEQAEVGEDIRIYELVGDPYDKPS